MSEIIGTQSVKIEQNQNIIPAVNYDPNALPLELQQIKASLAQAYLSAGLWAARVQANEGDSELLRKLKMYLVPNMKHWLDGAQNGNVLDLEKYFERIQKENSKKKR
jgi:hypothetical protein